MESHFFDQEEQYLQEATGPVLEEHGYNQSTKINPFAFQFFRWYVARKTGNLGIAKTCDDCYASLSKQSQEVEKTQLLIDKKSRGFLLKPSPQLYNFLVKVENVILSVLSNNQMNRNLLLDGEKINILNISNK